MDKDTRDNIWDDGLHLTKEGYEMMGDAIASRMIEFLKDWVGPRNASRKNSGGTGTKKPEDEHLSALLPTASSDGINWMGAKTSAQGPV